MLEMVIVQTLNGNYILKSPQKVKFMDSVEIELYGETIEDIKQQFKQHLKDIK